MDPDVPINIECLCITVLGYFPVFCAELKLNAKGGRKHPKLDHKTQTRSRDASRWHYLVIGLYKRGDGQPHSRIAACLPPPSSPSPWQTREAPSPWHMREAPHRASGGRAQANGGAYGPSRNGVIVLSLSPAFRATASL
ncbi:hypothetical protein B0H15DRAFT_952022 [Mycena belliarum]|uniref:Uncharacterized protein n=1 Tax=Mycena belliarum TaxID=1033014 RepID=A0AAD6XP55_9AGAR|nr:hypothetical protein B0H15DRAFT_952022 [Mycena belliae]